MTLAEMLAAIQPTCDVKRKRQVEATARWKAKNPDKVKAQQQRWHLRNQARKGLA